MSVNTNRAKLNKAQTNKEYNRIRWNIIYEHDIWDWGWNFNHGEISNRKWRSYRTWKHNRNTQWKE